MNKNRVNYKNKKCFVTGAGGFIGRHLTTTLIKLGASVIPFEGDVRNSEQLEQVFNPSFDYCFHFGNPSSEVLFKRNPRYCIDTTINSFLIISDLCKKNGVRLVYPSTGLLSQGKENGYARCKKICEDIHLSEKLDALGLRIFAGYGPGEEHKRDYASVVYLFTRAMTNGKKPEIFGDGSQKRDFIYIEDIVRTILVLAEECNDPIVDVGSGNQIEFNKIIMTINTLMKTKIKPDYIQRPSNYIEETLADTAVLKKFNVLPSVTLEKGIRNIINSLKQ